MSAHAHALKVALDLPFEVTLDGAACPTRRNFVVENPATATELARCPAVSREQLDEAVVGARGAQRDWREVSIDGRRTVMRTSVATPCIVYCGWGL